MLGCDTTSIFFGLGKSKLFKSFELEQNPNDAFLFTDNDCAIKYINDVGERIIPKLYGNLKSKTLDGLRVLTYKKKLLSKSAKNKTYPRRVAHHLQMQQLSTLHWGFIILCKSGESRTWTQRSMAFSISMPNSSLLRTLNHWHQEIYLRPFFPAAQNLLANQVNAPVKTFSYTVMNRVVAQIIVLTSVRSTMRSPLTLKKTSIKLTLLSMTLFWLLLLNHIMFIVFYIFITLF